jgi:hypothetical protein
MHNRSLTAAAAVRGRTKGGTRRRVVTVVVGALLTLGMLAAPAAAGGPPHHPHALLLHAEWTGSGPGTQIHSYERCIDLGNGRALPNHVHHASVHTGTAGAALQSAGHLVVPATCAQVAAFSG